MTNFEAFIRGDTEAKAEGAQSAYQAAHKVFIAKRINVAAVAQTRRRIAIENPPLAKKVIRFLASARLRRAKCLAALASSDPMVIAPLAEPPLAELASFAENLRAYARQLDDAADPEGRRVLQAELDDLADRLTGMPPSRSTVTCAQRGSARLRTSYSAASSTATGIISTPST